MTSKQIIENNLISALEAMCEESLSPDVFQEWQHVKDQLINNRKLVYVSAQKSIYESNLKKLFLNNKSAVDWINSQMIIGHKDLNQMLFLKNWEEAIVYLNENLRDVSLIAARDYIAIKDRKSVIYSSNFEYETDELRNFSLISHLFEGIQKCGWFQPF